MTVNGLIIYRRTLLLIVFALCVSSLKAQDETLQEFKKQVSRVIKKKDTTSKIWKTGGNFNLNLGQGSQSNWAAGGDDFSFSINSYLGLHAFYKKGRYSWDNTLDLNYGLVNTSSQGTRKNDDRIDLLTKVGSELLPKLSLSALANLRTQFSKGYTYYSNDSTELISNIFAPAYLLFSVGLDYKPVDGLSIFVSPVTSRWTFVLDDSLSAKGAYGVRPGEHMKSEIGAFASINYLANLSETISYNGRLDLFSNYGHNPQNVDLLMNNKFNAKFSKSLTASLAVDMIYDDDVKLFGKNDDSPGLQLRSLIGVGFTFVL